MKNYNFVSAKPIFYPYTPFEYKEVKDNSTACHYGFYKNICIKKDEIDSARVAISAQNIYRLYINEEIVMQGPRRTAHGYLRVDDIDVSKYLLGGENHIAVELIEYGNMYNKYSNDSTLEDGMLIMEICSGKKRIFSTGVEDMSVLRLDYRVKKSERISHSREAIEIYNINEDSGAWRKGKGEYLTATAVDIDKTYLCTSVLIPTLKKLKFENVISYGACRIDKNKKFKTDFYEGGDYFERFDEYVYKDCRQTVDIPPTCTKISKKNGEFFIESGEDSYIMLDMGRSAVGLLCIDMESDAGTVDIVRSEMLDKKGNMPYYYGTVSRVHTSGGNIRQVFFEAGLYRYLKIYFRGCKNIRIKDISLLEYSYPDENKCSFLCNDENINKLYRAAKDTLLFNALDVFMDCPDRERGGWLCDSLWTARAASLMLSDDRVEREMLETFLLTDKDGMYKGFYPEAYPASKDNYKAFTGITTWSFWLMCQLCEYVNRTGDIEFALEFKERVAAFVCGSMSYLGESGMLENLPCVFVDWSMANNAVNVSPISTAANALYSYTLENLGKLYDEKIWVDNAISIRNSLKKAIEDNGGGAIIPDSFERNAHGKLVGRGYTSEACTFTALWAGLYNKEENMPAIKFAKDHMGTCPKYPSDLNIGKSNLFIGLCIRLDMLARLGYYDVMFKDMLDIYMWQLKEGPGTLWECNYIDTSSRCHGFSSHVGVHLLRDVLGFADINKKEGYITIAPHICSLKWARGCVDIDGYMAMIEWRCHSDEFYLNIDIPENYKYSVRLPDEVRKVGYFNVKVMVNGKQVQ